jgi:hypothetical protein
MSLIISYLEREKKKSGRVGGRTVKQAGIFKVRLGLLEIEGVIEGRGRDTERQRYREIERHRNKETKRQS